MSRQSLLLVRLLALAGFLISLTLLLGNLAQSYDSFNPSYAGFFFKQQLARPVIGLAISLLTAAASRPLARLLARGIDE